MITSYKELPVGKYLELESIVLGYPDDVERNTLVLSVLTGKTPKELMNMPLEEYTALNRKAAFLATPPDPRKRVASSYRAGRFDLVPVHDFRKITTAQYVDFQSFLKAGSDSAVDVDVLSCFLVPKGCTYCDGYEPSEVKAAIREGLSVEDALTLHRFFFLASVNSMRRSATSLTARAKRLGRMAVRLERTGRADPGAVEAIKRKVRTMEEETDRLLSRTDGDGLRMSMPFQRLSAVIGIPSGR